eukprot:SAG31_NODE_3555_length_4129_cov_1.868734_2_plen_401_part_00
MLHTKILNLRDLTFPAPIEKGSLLNLVRIGREPACTLQPAPAGGTAARRRPRAVCVHKSARALAPPRFEAWAAGFEEGGGFVGDMQPCTKLGSAAARRLGTIGRALVTARSPQARHALAMAHSTAAEASPHQSSMGTVVTVAAVEKPEAFSPDCIVLVSPFMAPLDASTTYGFLEPLLAAGAEIDNRVRISVALVPLPDRPFGCPRLVASPATLHSWDPTDIRGFAAAAQAGVNVACAAGAERPLLVVDGDHDAALVAGVAASEAWYVPLEAREAGRSNGNLAAVTLGLAMCKGPVPKGIPARASAAALGLTLSRDICGGSPERMTPLKTAAMVEAAFADTPVVVEVVSGREALEEHYPLLAAVDRGSAPRHAGCVVKLSYRGQQATRSTFLGSLLSTTV